MDVTSAVIKTDRDGWPYLALIVDRKAVKVWPEQHRDLLGRGYAHILPNELELPPLEIEGSGILGLPTRVWVGMTDDPVVVSLTKQFVALAEFVSIPRGGLLLDVGDTKRRLEELEETE